MEIQGKVIQILPIQSGIGKQSGKEWKKQDFILETVEQFPKKICIEHWNDAVDRTALQVGEDITVQFDIESQEFQGRWYTKLKAWRIDRGFVTLHAQPQAKQAVQTAPAQPSSQQQSLGSGQPPQGDDLPF